MRTSWHSRLRILALQKMALEMSFMRRRMRIVANCISEEWQMDSIISCVSTNFDSVSVFLFFLFQYRNYQKEYVNQPVLSTVSMGKVSNMTWPSIHITQNHQNPLRFFYVPAVRGDSSSNTMSIHPWLMATGSSSLKYKKIWPIT